MEKFKKALKDVAFISKIVNSEKDEEYKEKTLATLLESHEDFRLILIPAEKNEFREKLESKYRTLNFFQQHRHSLQTQIKNSREKGLALGSRIPNYLKDLKPTTKAEKRLPRKFEGRRPH